MSTATGRRAVAVRHEITGVLETVTALRVGGWAPAAYADLAVSRDGLGRVIIPGTSLAGALRAWLGTVTAPGGGYLFDTMARNKVFGSLVPKGRGGEVCRIRVDDAVAEGETSLGIRDGVGIDRSTGAAAAGVLYRHEVVPPGTRFGVRIIASQRREDPERVGEALDLIVAALAAGRVEIGASRSRGLGSVRLVSARRSTVDFTDRAQTLAWLCGRQPSSPVSTATGSLPAADGRLDIEITWLPVSPVMVQASTVNEPEPSQGDDGRAVDTVPLRTTNQAPNGSAQLLLPGSSIKGVLRSHAERIMRSLLGIAELPPSWLDQVNDPRLKPVGALFGLVGDHSKPARPGQSEDEPPSPAQETTEPEAEERRRSLGRRGALSVHDCHGTATAERVSTHVAVDRWTGGAAENLLFSVQEPSAAGWQPMRLSLDVHRLTRGDEDGDAQHALVLLMLILRDLSDGWLAVGFGGTRGRGAISVSNVTFSGTGLPPPWTDLCGHTLAEVISSPPGAVDQALTSWREAMTS